MQVLSVDVWEVETRSGWKKWSHVENDGCGRKWSEEIPTEVDLLILEEGLEMSGNAASSISVGPYPNFQAS